MRYERTCLLLVAVLLVCSSIPAHALFPMWPQYPDCGFDYEPESCPDDLNQAWDYISYVREDIADNPGFRQAELEIGSGMWADAGWSITTGDPSILIAVLDSGIKWDEYDLLNKAFINAGELPLPQIGEDTAATHDANGDGVVNIRDYEQDPRVLIDAGVDRADDRLDASDLIYTFSDGVDDDGNGYIDDISGWDTFWNDNDPYDQTRYGHGTGEAKDSAAEGDNGSGTPGGCPNCMFVPVRVSDSFLADDNNFADGVFYAATIGAKVVQEALGTISNSRVSIDAIEYAYRHGILIDASAADENSFHHNYPASNDHTLYVHATVPDHGIGESTTTFLNFSNCTNWGAHLHMSAATGGCSSGATGKHGGAAGLVYSKALLEGLTLSADEAKQIFIMSADDIHVPEWDEENPITKWPSYPGWDHHFGYGKLNVYRAMLLTAPGKVPPEADIADPDWFTPIIYDRTPRIEIKGHASSRSGDFSWVLEYAYGVQPDKDEPGNWVEIDSGNANGPIGSAAEPVVLAEWDVAAVPEQTDLDPDLSYVGTPDTWREEIDQYTITLRLRVEDSDGNRGEDRQTVYIHNDPDLVDGFPRNLVIGGGPSPKLADMDGDGVDEIVLPLSDGYIHVFRADGSELPGWPSPVQLMETVDLDHPGNHLNSPPFLSGELSTDYRANILASPAVADLDGDGSLEVVITTMKRWTFAFNSDGSVREGWPVDLHESNDEIKGRTSPDARQDQGIFASPVAADLDGDGDLEVVVAAMNQYLYAWNHDGTMVDGFPVWVKRPDTPDNYRDRILSTPAVADADGDGIADILLCTNEHEGGEATGKGPCYLVHGDGNNHAGGPFHDGWPQLFASFNILPYVGEGIPQCPAMVDVEGDGTLEMLIASTAQGMTLVEHTGETIKIFPAGAFGPDAYTNEVFGAGHIASPSIGDIDFNGDIEVFHNYIGGSYLQGAAMDSMRTEISFLIGAQNIEDGSWLDTFPRLIEDHQFFIHPAVGDITGDCVPEVISTGGGYTVRAYSADGSEPEGWAKFTGQWQTASPALGDIDGDGLLEVVINTRDGWLYAWNTDGKAANAGGNVQWGSFHGNNANTGVYDRALLEVDCEPVVVPGDDDDDDVPANDDDDDDGGSSDDGCGCQGNPGAGSLLILLLAASLLAWRKRAA